MNQNLYFTFGCYKKQRVYYISQRTDEAQIRSDCDCQVSAKKATH